MNDNHRTGGYAVLPRKRRGYIPGEPRWRPVSAVSQCCLPPGLAAWLLDSSSLTQRLQQSSRNEFRVQVLKQGWRRPMENERQALGMRRGALAWVRQVHLLCDGQAWVFARTVIPAATLHGGQRRLARLGERPLGAMLFADRSVRRGPMEIAVIPTGSHLHRIALGGRRKTQIWGRRSLFYYGTRPLLVSEIFLPALRRHPA